LGSRAALNVTPARRCAFRVIRRVFEQGAYADRAFRAEAAGLDGRDRALAMTLSYGTIQRRATLDHVAARFGSRPPGKLEPQVLAALRLGLFQLLLLDRVADHAAVSESVELAKPAGASYVNAVLRRAAREGRELLESLGDHDVAGAALVHSFPSWIVRRWWDELGSQEARALLSACNEPAESALRVNELVARREDLAARLPVRSRPADGLPEGLVLEEPFDAHGSAEFADGAIMPQSRGSMLASRTLDPQPRERVLDLCAAPGAKTTHLAALSGDQGEIVAVEHHRGRAAALERTCVRMRASSVRVVRSDAAQPPVDGGFQRVLVDPPCSGLGTLQSRPDLRWRASPDSVGELAALQLRILAAGAERLAPGGTLVYSVCTISRAEAGDVVRALIASEPGFALISERQLLPHHDGTDGFYIARLERSRAAARLDTRE
jgi:16S rRNA (cytosine967-C5)-methyltransferase